MISQWLINLPANSIREGQIRAEPPLILNKGVVLPGSGVNEAPARLAITIRKPKQKVGAWVARRKRATTREAKCSIVLEIEWIRYVASPKVYSPLVRVLARRIGKIIDNLARVIQARLWSVIRKTHGK